jgi:glycine/D-amino acid oxidase-like deaminating enzyme
VSDAPPDLGRSWWLREALARPEFAGERCPPLETETAADVVILGGGYTGMWTAWFLKERDPGIDVVLLEQDICGGGPSGRNGGFCDGWWGHLRDLVDTFGDADALELLMHVGRSPSEIGEWCEANDVDAWFRMGGDLAVASATSQEGSWDLLLATAARLGLRDEYEVLSAEQVREHVRSPAFGSGIFVRDAANLQPARLARGLRNALVAKGVRIHEGTPVTRFGLARPAIAETPGGSVRAGEAVIALGAWATWWNAFKPFLTVRGSYMVVTEPIPDLLETIGWTGGENLRDHRSSIHYLRTTADHRIAMGLGGLQPDLARSIDPRYVYHEPSVRHVAADLIAMFPELAGVRIDAGWGGPINVSGLALPFFGTLEPGNVHYGLGYTGNGVGPSHLGGKICASLAMRADDGFTRSPLVTREPRRFPPEPIRSPGMFVANKAIVRKDDLEAGGGRAGALTRTVATLPRRLGYHLGPRPDPGP